MFVCMLHLNLIIRQTHRKVLNFHNACQVHSVQRVSTIKSILSANFHAIYRAVCIQLTHSMMIGRIRVLYLSIIIKSEIWPICNCLRLSHEKMVCAICLSISLCAFQVDFSLCSIRYLYWNANCFCVSFISGAVSAVCCGNCHFCVLMSEPGHE